MTRRKLMARSKLMEKFAFIVVAAGALAIAPARAAVSGAADAIRAASDNGSIAEQVQFRFGGYDYCYYDDGWKGSGWYWCGYAHRPGFGWGGPIGWNSWRWEGRDRDDHREFRDRDDHREFRGRDDRRDRDDRHDHDDRRRF